jgi:23S rRNA (guanine745-N1)-methyltransferase
VIPPLACTVRDCGLLLQRQARTYVCARRHAYDVARRGYVNLLQPGDRRSSQAGDRPDAIAARARLLSRGVGAVLVDTLARRILDHAARDAVVADLGAGSGELLGAVQPGSDRAPLTAIGIDISTAAAEHAARRYPDVVWAVANADRRLPLLDRTVDVIVSMHGRRNPIECARVLARGGRLLIAIPAPDDLLELRQFVHGDASERLRDETLERVHAPLFDAVDRRVVRERHELDADALRDLLLGSYRGARRSAAARIESLNRLHVTLASTIVEFRLREPR